MKENSCWEAVGIGTREWEKSKGGGEKKNKAQKTKRRENHQAGKMWGGGRTNNKIERKIPWRMTKSGKEGTGAGTKGLQAKRKTRWCQYCLRGPSYLLIG